MIRLGKVWGVALSVHIAFPVMLLAMIVLGHGAVLVPMLSVLLLHEAAHALAAAALGLKVTSLELMPFGGTARVEGAHSLRPGQEALVALAGPAVNLILAMGAAFCVYVLHMPGSTVQTFVRCNLVLMACNLLPALPLDGGRALRALLTPLCGRHAPTRILSFAGVGLALALLGLAVWGAVHGVVNLSFFGAAAYLAYAAAQAKHTVTASYIQTLSRHTQALREEKALPVRWLSVMGDVPVSHVAEMFLPRYTHMVLVYAKNGQDYRTLQEWQLLDALIEDASMPIERVGKAQVLREDMAVG